MTEIPQGYRDVPEEDRKKARVFFDRGRTVSDTGNYDYAIEMYLQGLAIDPDDVDAHTAIRDISLKRKASGGKDLGMMEKFKLKRAAKDERQTMLNSAKLLAYDPGNTDHMVSLLQSAHRAGFYDTAMWLGPIVQKANSDSRTPDFQKFIILKDIYKDLKQWKLASDAAQYASMLRPDDMDLLTEIKNLSAYHTMTEGNYGSAGSFRKSLRDADKQDKLRDSDKDIRSSDVINRQIADAEAEWKAEPEELGKLQKLIDALLKSETLEHDSRAIELLGDVFTRTKQFRFRHQIGRIRLAQLARQDRAMRTQVRATPNDPVLNQQYAEFYRKRLEEELSEFTLWSENYPTDMSFRFRMAERLFHLGRFDEAIPLFQQSRNDPKFRGEAGTYLGRAFLEAGYNDEAVETIKSTIDEYKVPGDEKSKEMYYWYGRALEKKGQNDMALKCFSQVAQWDFNYRDVQSRVKKLR